MENYFPNQTPNTTAVNSQIPNDFEVTTTPNSAIATTPNTDTANTPNTATATTPNTTLDPALNSTPVTAPNTTEPAAPVEIKSQKKECVDKPPRASKKKPTRTSDVWDHFTKLVGEDPEDPRCRCNYCGLDYACHSRRIGTSTLWGHLEKCKNNPHKVVDKKQKVLSFHGANLLATTFNKVRCRNALAKFVVKDEQTFRVVEGAENLLNN
ncbi:hypothetical protein POM88_040800 [Heracleum sosnowskyi]|uniref:BED-type domain-containing protein n=1 Tax=Heracleum sosnowskyi TaxID=360622 RepID=A0AAD8MA39_9APIA|nr:hypothetical protein POM88_040800 [Heracleum sosnowskyi]